MSKLEELIEKLCPKGVIYKNIGDIVIIEKGKQLNKTLLSDSGKYPVINGGITPSGYWDEYNYQEGLITISQGGASAGFVNYIETKFWAGAHCYVVSKVNEGINYRYIYHFLKSKEVELQNFQVGAGIPSISLLDIKKLYLAVPPIEVQNEIVRILDNFTELEARKKQYEYYKEKLLRFSKNDSNVKWTNLGTYCNRLKGTAITASKMKEISENDGNVKIFAGGKTLIKTSEKNIPKEDIITVPNIIVQSRGIIDFIYYDKPCSFKREMWSYTTDNKITLKFIYYYLKNNVEYFRQRGSQMGSMPQISLDVTEKYKIPIPPIEEQERIVSILDKFDKLCNDITQGLPAEIEARKKQYEYYRDKLLNFKELKVENKE